MQQCQEMLPTLLFMTLLLMKLHLILLHNMVSLLQHPLISDGKLTASLNTFEKLSTIDRIQFSRVKHQQSVMQKGLTRCAWKSVIPTNKQTEMKFCSCSKPLQCYARLGVECFSSSFPYTANVLSF